MKRYSINLYCYLIGFLILVGRALSESFPTFLGFLKVFSVINEKYVHLQLHIIATRAGIHHSEWVENVDRWVDGFLEKFKEGCYLMVSIVVLILESKSLPGC